MRQNDNVPGDVPIYVRQLSPCYPKMELEGRNDIIKNFKQKFKFSYTLQCLVKAIPCMKLKSYTTPLCMHASDCIEFTNFSQNTERLTADTNFWFTPYTFFL